MVFIRRFSIAVLGCCLLGFQEVPEAAEPQGTEVTQTEGLESESTWDADSLVVTKLTPTEAIANDYFSYCVAISGNRAIVGAYGDIDSETGSAYLFDVTTGEELFKLTASDAAVGDLFGWCVAISGNTAIVGARSHGDNSAYLFDVTTGDQLFKLTASAANLLTSVAISGNRAVVGTSGDDRSTGSVYVFDVTTGEKLFELNASDTAEGNWFGLSVAICGNTAIVGAPGVEGENGFSPGAVYVFNVPTGNQQHKLVTRDTGRHGNFGTSVAIRGNTVIVGNYLDDDGGLLSGSAYLFDVITGEELFKLTASDAAVGDLFGHSVAISGKIAIVGAYGDGGNKTDLQLAQEIIDGLNMQGEDGSVYVFDVTTGEELFKLAAPDAAGNDQFGWSVAISGNTAIVGASESGDNDAPGSAYLYTPEP